MKRLGDLLKPSTALAKIPPPGRSYAGIERWAKDCEDAGLASTIIDERGRDTGILASPWAIGIARLRREARAARDEGLPYEEFELRFNAAIDRDRQASREAMKRNERTVARAVKERNAHGKPESLTFDEAKDHLEKRGL